MGKKTNLQGLSSQGEKKLKLWYVPYIFRRDARSLQLYLTFL